ncbi:response regulator [Myxococcota bacterium]|nr:response regulator [Myxococcota bacterium]
MLVVEDHEDAREAVRSLLEIRRCRVDVAEDGERGLERARAAVLGAAVGDLGLPGMDGCALARRLREELGPGVRLVALTACGQPTGRRRTREAEVDAHLLEPVDASELERALEGGSAARASASAGEPGIPPTSP